MSDTKSISKLLKRASNLAKGDIIQIGEKKGKERISVIFHDKHSFDQFMLKYCSKLKIRTTPSFDSNWYQKNKVVVLTRRISKSGRLFNIGWLWAFNKTRKLEVFS